MIATLLRDLLVVKLFYTVLPLIYLVLLSGMVVTRYSICVFKIKLIRWTLNYLVYDHEFKLLKLMLSLFEKRLANF